MLGCHEEQRMKLGALPSVVATHSLCSRPGGVAGGAGPSAALGYARAHFGAFQESELGEIQRLMGALCFVRRPPSARASPYADLMAPGQWAAAARDFSRQCCGLLGQVAPAQRLPQSSSRSTSSLGPRCSPWVIGNY